jgi:hypothetical protein
MRCVFRKYKDKNFLSLCTAVFIYHVPCGGPSPASGGLSHCTNAASYMNISNYHGNWFFRMVWSLCENCVLYFLLCYYSNKELFLMLTSLNGTFAAVLMRLPFFVSILNQCWGQAVMWACVFASSRCCTQWWLSNVCLWKPKRNRSALYFRLDYTGFSEIGRHFLNSCSVNQNRCHSVQTCVLACFGSSLWPPWILIHMKGIHNADVCTSGSRMVGWRNVIVSFISI